MIQTDGISICILFKQQGRFYGQRSFNKTQKDPYVKDNLQLVKQRRVLIDPNKRDMLYCFGPPKEPDTPTPNPNPMAVENIINHPNQNPNPMAISSMVDRTRDTANFKKLRYTSMQRRRETGDKRFRIRREQMTRNFYRQQGWLDPDGDPVFDID